MVKHVKEIEEQMSTAMDFQIADTQAAKDTTEFFHQRMREHIKDDRLLKGMTPEAERPRCFKLIESRVYANMESRL